MLTEFKLSIEDLKAIVMALHHEGEYLNGIPLFSSQETGKLKQVLAKDLDEFVNDLDPDESDLVLHSESDFDTTQSDKIRRLENAEATLGEIKIRLGVDPMQGDIYAKLNKLLSFEEIIEQNENEMDEITKALGCPLFVTHATIMSKIRSLMATQPFQEKVLEKETKSKKKKKKKK